MTKSFLLLLLLSIQSLAIHPSSSSENLEWPINEMQESPTVKFKQELVRGSQNGTSVISGLIFDSETNELVADDYNAWISLIRRDDSNSEWESVESYSFTGSNFQFNELANGEYLISISKPYSLRQEQQAIYMPTIWHPNGEVIESVGEISNDSLITINNDNTVINVDFNLVPAAILVVTNNDNNGDNLNYFLSMNNDNEFQRSIAAIENTIINNQSTSITFLYKYLPVGDYRFYTNSNQFDADSQINEIYGEGECYSCKLELLSGKGNTVSLSKFEIKMIDITPSQGGSISGAISYEQSEEQLSDYSWMLLSTAYEPIEKIAISIDDVSEHGEYKINGLSEGEYYARFMRNGYIRESYSDIACPYFNCQEYQSRPIRIKKGENKIEIDSDLKKGTIISGTILDAETGESLIEEELTSIGNHFVEILDENFNIVGGEYNRSDRQDSFYLRNSLTNGKYYIKTGSTHANNGNKNYINQVYPGIECEGNICDYSQAELIEINSLETINGINFNLNKSYSISGVVRNEGGEVLENVEVVVLNQQGLFVDVGLSSADGSYTIKGLKSGSYFVRTYNGNKKHFFFDQKQNNIRSSWVNQIYPVNNCRNNSCSLTENNLVHISQQNLTHIDFELQEGLSLSGYVRNDIRAIGIPGIEIKIFTESDEFVESYFTGEYGQFATAALEPGDYKIITENTKQFVNQAYGGYQCGLGDCDVTQSELVSLAESSKENIDFELVAGQDYYPDLSGLWYNPEQSGHGLQIEVLKSGGTATLYVSWYVVKDGQTMWLTGTGPLNKDLAFVDLSMTNGNSFPPNFDPEAVELTPWGSLQFKFSDMDHAQMSWTTEVEGFINGSIELNRLTHLSTTQRQDNSIDACLSGTYYNTDQSGHGVMIEVLGESAESMALTWFTYNDNKQFWLLANGAINAETAHLSAIYTSGSDFPPNFDSGMNDVVNWGEINLTKIDQDNIQIQWSPNSEHSSFGSGSVMMKRLTQIEGIGCN